VDKKAYCKAALNSVADALYVIGGKWKRRIISALTEGNQKFHGIQRLIDACL
jgi:DNA-binding HxlR family transcriptional regulator